MRYVEVGGDLGSDIWPSWPVRLNHSTLGGKQHATVNTGTQGLLFLNFNFNLRGQNPLKLSTFHSYQKTASPP